MTPDEAEATRQFNTVIHVRYESGKDLLIQLCQAYGYRAVGMLLAMIKKYELAPPLPPELEDEP